VSASGLPPDLTVGSRYLRCGALALPLCRPAMPVGAGLAPAMLEDLMTCTFGG
jgi:hypothetical protein